MKQSVFVPSLVAIVFAVLTLGSVEAFAHRSSVHFGLSVGYPGWYYPPPYYYPPVHPYFDPYYYPSYGYPAGATSYIEQAVPPQVEASSHWWYYCAAAKAYYPYVRECAGGWQRVSPTPPPGR